MLKGSLGGLSAVVGVRTGPDNQMAQDVYSSGLYIHGSNASTEFVVDGGNEKVPVPLFLFRYLFSVSCAFCPPMVRSRSLHSCMQREW